MIHIEKGRYLDSIAQEWLDDIRHFFCDQRYCYISIPNSKKRRTFKNYAEKLRFQCLQIAIDKARDKRHRNRCLKRLIFWWRHFDDIILANPKMMQKRVIYWNRMNSETLQFLEALSPVFVWFYEHLPQTQCYELIEKLNIKTCPYCNRQFIHSFHANRNERPELDHFHPKSKYPIFCLSFYNLIPSCHSCNHVKLDDEINVNPYDRPFRRKFVIKDRLGRIISKSAIFKLTEKEIRLGFDGHDADEEENDKVLGLTDVYNHHTDYVKEIIDKSMAYDHHARKALVNSFQGAGYHPRQVFDFVWGKKLLDAEHGDRPLSKLTKDLLDLFDIRRK